MKGDFSHWRFDPHENFSGVLQQQGRVLLDRDWNEQTRIATHWHDQAGRDAIGEGVAAVPVLAPDGYRVTQAQVAIGPGGEERVELRVHPGRIWADGILCHLAPSAAGPAIPVLRVADYLQPPVQSPPGTVASIAPGARDAVILEVSHEAMNGFQDPERLIEAALGGPDTTERDHLRQAFRLFRLGAGQNCHSILPLLADEPADKGRLTVRLEPTQAVDSDCPVVVGGGYSGFEHHLYRIEVAAVNAAQPSSFKWSQFNGGLVGRGELRTAPDRIVITANHAAIVNSGLTDFYCEVLAFAPGRGIWMPVFGADVTLSNDELQIGTVRLGAFSATTETVFFRLWNGIQPVNAFTNSANPVELLDGIQLVFDAPAASNYIAGDYWTFPVRAGTNVPDEVLIDDQPPEGPVYHRVPLAEITWGAPNAPVVPPEIEDCRRRFRPLSRQDTCCTFRVGDGHTSLGDFNSIQAAVDALPPEGGQVCVLPGEFIENVVVLNRTNVCISGCGPRTRIIAPAPGPDASTAPPVIHLIGGSGLRLDSFAVEAAETGPGIVAEGRNPFSRRDQGPTATELIRGLAIDAVHVRGGIRAALRVRHALDVSVTNCVLAMRDAASLEHACVVLVHDALLEDNVIEVSATREPGALALSNRAPVDFAPGTRALGGLLLEGLCQRVRVVDNLIRGGIGNGITLGSFVFLNEGGDPVPPEDEPPGPERDPCSPRDPVDMLVANFIVVAGIRIRIGAGGPLRDIRIERNRIHAMGMNGIGVHGFFDLSQADEFISVYDLTIIGNEIAGCLRRTLAPIAPAMADAMGYGAISLADVENLVAHDNTLLDNGVNLLEPTCGIFVLHGEGVDICRNRILNHGTLPEDPAGTAAGGSALAAVKRGRRGGINLVYAFAPSRATNTILGANRPVDTGVPAARIHENIVVAPLGRALTLRAFGPVSVVGNQFTSKGVTPATADPAGALAAVVSILNHGLSNELYLQVLANAFAGLGSGNDKLTTGGVASTRPGLDDVSYGSLLANGHILFNDNQVSLDLLARGVSVAMSGIMLMSFDDIAFQNNQCEADLLDDVLFIHSFVFGLISVRATGNRWKEGIYNCLLSALVASLYQTAVAHNEATHCIAAGSFADTSPIISPNKVLVENPAIAGMLGSFGESLGAICQAFRNILNRG